MPQIFTRGYHVKNCCGHSSVDRKCPESYCGKQLLLPEACNIIIGYVEIREGERIETHEASK